MKNIYIYDSVKKQKVLFEPIIKDFAKVYVCGPTVYDDSHLGHARSAISFDLLHRVLKANGYKVEMVKNFTDIDDKIIAKVEQSGKSLEEITTFYIDAYKADMQSLNILPNSQEPKATQNIEAMIEMIEDLIKKKCAYIIEDGVYFDTLSDKSYGSLSKRFDDESSISRVEDNSNKKNSKDFALWKIKKDENISYNASFGRGRPGWHIECSAMINKNLAYTSDVSSYQIDIHGGGADLLFPHHENEATQTKCSSGQNLSKYWVHNGFVNVNGEKMSKSLGNSFFLKDILNSYSGEIVRFYLLTAHYVSNFNFSEDDLISSKKRLDKLYRLKKRVYGAKASKSNEKFKNSVIEALNDDLNSPKAISIVDELINSANEKLDVNQKDKNLKNELVANIEFIADILGIGQSDAYEYFQFGVSKDEISKIEEQIQKRDEAKKEKNFQKADQIRDELLNKGISLMDTPNKTLWEKL